MDKKILYAVSGLFSKPDDIMHAAEETAKAGYKNYDVNTPYPLHGMSKAMRIPHSKLGYVALAIGLFGVAFAILSMSWISILGYPLVIGGKPYFSLPAFIPVTFEVTVLSASIATFVTMVFIFFKLPNVKHPLHDTEYLKSVSTDKFGIIVQADDPIFNEEQVKQFLSSLGAENIKAIYYDEEELNVKNKVFEPKFIIFLIVVAILNSAAVYIVYNKVLYLNPFNFMDNQAKLNPQEPAILSVNGYGMRLPVEGTVARGHLPYLYAGNTTDAEKYLANPLLPSKQYLNKGQQKFNTFCSPCHGYFAEGKSRLQGQFPSPPSLQSEKYLNWKDADIFNIITMGSSIMPSYASQISEDERWQIILYIRALQRSQHAKETDLQ
jgi:mono/diheme cytochrome c family protein